MCLDGQPMGSPVRATRSGEACGGVELFLHDVCELFEYP